MRDLNGNVEKDPEYIIIYAGHVRHVFRGEDIDSDNSLVISKIDSYVSLQFLHAKTWQGSVCMVWKMRVEGCYKITRKEWF